MGCLIEESRRSLKRRGEDGRRQKGEGRKKGQSIPNGSKYHRTESNIDLMERRTGGEAGRCSGLGGRTTHKAEGAIDSKSGWFHIYLGVFQKTGYVDIEKGEQSGGSRSGRRIRGEALAIERTEMTGEDLRSAHRKGQNVV
jgi:hypothetical protein